MRSYPVVKACTISFAFKRYILVPASAGKKAESPRMGKARKKWGGCCH